MSTDINPKYRDTMRSILLKNSDDFYLLLIEFYVKQVTSDRLGSLNDMLSAPTRVRFKIAELVNDDGLEVTPVDLVFQPQAGFATSVEIFNVGISMLSAIKFTAVLHPPRLILHINVEKWLPNIDLGRILNCLVGIGKLDMSEEYEYLQFEMLQCWKEGVTRSKTFDGQIPLTVDGEPSGTLDVFVRISSPGQMIVTDFNAPVPQDSRMFIFCKELADHSSMYKFHEVNTCTDDLFEDFSKNVQCPICLPERYCVPCEMAAVQETDELVAERPLQPTRGLPEPCGNPHGNPLGNPHGNPHSNPHSNPHENPRGNPHDNPHSNPHGNPVVLKVSGLFDNGDGKKPTVTVANENVITKQDNPPNPDYDIFVLRIGKKGLVGIGEKSDIQLEMKTPKGPERRPPIRYETREMQTDVKKEDVMKEDVKKVVKDRKKKHKKKKK